MHYRDDPIKKHKRTNHIHNKIAENNFSGMEMSIHFKNQNLATGIIN